MASVFVFRKNRLDDDTTVCGVKAEGIKYYVWIYPRENGIFIANGDGMNVCVERNHLGTQLTFTRPKSEVALPTPGEEDAIADLAVAARDEREEEA